MCKLTAYTVNMPMARSFGHSAKKRTRAESLILTFENEGIRANGECAPRNYVTGETLDSVASELAQLNWKRYHAGLESSDPAGVLQEVLECGVGQLLDFIPQNNTNCALELLAIDVLCKRLQTSALAYLTESELEKTTRPFSQVKDSSLPVEEFMASHGPFHTVKVKATSHFSDDLETLDRLRSTIGLDTEIIFDVNMGWTFDQAVIRCKALRDRQVNIVEEPLLQHSFSALAKLQRSTGIKVMLDESLCKQGDAIEAVKHKSCTYFNLRVAKLGGITPALKLARFADAVGIGYQVGVQVAECATLIDAGRTLSFLLPKAFTTEAGQSDLFFPIPVARPSSKVNRVKNVVTAPVDIGFGTVTTAALKQFETTRFI